MKHLIEELDHFAAGNLDEASGIGQMADKMLALAVAAMQDAKDSGNKGNWRSYVVNLSNSLGAMRSALRSLPSHDIKGKLTHPEVIKALDALKDARLKIRALEPLAKAGRLSGIDVSEGTVTSTGRYNSEDKVMKPYYDKAVKALGEMYKQGQTGFGDGNGLYWVVKAIVKVVKKQDIGFLSPMIKDALKESNDGEGSEIQEMGGVDVVSGSMTKQQMDKMSKAVKSAKFYLVESSDEFGRGNMLGGFGQLSFLMRDLAGTIVKVTKDKKAYDKLDKAADAIFGVAEKYVGDE